MPVKLDSSVQVNLDNASVESTDERPRLLASLNRYIDGLGRRQNPAELHAQEAALLTAIWWGEEHPECIPNQTQLAALLNIGNGGISEKINENLHQKGLCRLLTRQEKEQVGINSNRSNYFYLTPKGKDALVCHAAAHDFSFEDFRKLQATPNTTSSLAVLLKFWNGNYFDDLGRRDGSDVREHRPPYSRRSCAERFIVGPAWSPSFKTKTMRGQYFVWTSYRKETSSDIEYSTFERQ